ncbi:MlaC/ttg2D family ABC transporter substrate-binding protein [Caulobacter sp. KR2-114]|uniref:MlaC/ttg2D family ABC transporter substrate-binding protein n=1 Tax=Caulobacter sp. KR2-114 TaxID=3400912 RepID=UPI003C09172F
MTPPARTHRKCFAGLATDRRVLLTGLAAALALAPGAPALAAAPRDPGAEQFVQVQGARLVSILADRSRGQAQRISAFRAAVDEVADVPRITRFVLGKYARTITPAQMQRFAPVFRDYAQDVYQRQLADFRGRTLTVTGSVVRKPGDVVVATRIAGDDGNPPGEVSWRVLGAGAQWKVVDVEVSGVWLAITQQQDFVSTIDNHGGDVGALITQLEKQTQGPAAARDR